MKFTVLMSVYRSDNTFDLYMALYSLFFQTHKPSEVVLVGDGDLPDGILVVIDRFSNLLPIEFFQLETNVGLGQALNGTRASKS